MNIIDLKDEMLFLDQYIRLRNKHGDRLLTQPVNRTETEAWLRREDIVVKGLADNEVLLGVVILYVSKGGEIAFFAETPNRGIGTRLLQMIEEEAGEKKLPSIWAWVLSDNPIARHVFEKRGFVREEPEDRFFKGERKTGSKFRKYLRNHEKGEKS